MPSLGGNWVDLTIIVALLFFVADAWRLGLWLVLADFGAFLGSLVISLRFYQLVSEILRSNFSLSHSLSNALGFLFTAVVVETLLKHVFMAVISRLPRKFLRSWWSKLLGIVPSLGQALVLVAFVLSVVVGLPVSGGVKEDIANSKIGGKILINTSLVEKTINEVFGGVIEDTLTYLVVKPGSEESIQLKVGKQELAVDERSEVMMFDLINEERRKRGIVELDWDKDLMKAARAHARDMWERSYFGHVSPDGDDVGDRLSKLGVKFFLAGENLALAPTLSTAHTGLMNSQGHRENILSRDFARVGIGVIENGYYGKMFVQVFTD